MHYGLDIDRIEICLTMVSYMWYSDLPIVIRRWKMMIRWNGYCRSSTYNYFTDKERFGLELLEKGVGKFFYEIYQMYISDIDFEYKIGRNFQYQISLRK